MSSSPDAAAIMGGLSQLCKTLDGQEWVMGRLDLSGRGYSSLGTELRAYRHLLFLNASGNELGSTEKVAGEEEEAAGEVQAQGEEEAEAEGDAVSERGLHALDALLGMTSLLALNLANNSVLTLPEGLSLPNLQIVNLSGNRLIQIPLRAEMVPVLVSLDISNNALSDVTGIDGMNTLRVLNLNGNSVISKLGDLGKLPALERLAARDCGLTDTAGFEGLSAACKDMDLSGNQINDLSGFTVAARSLSGLKSLNLAGNAIDNLEQLVHLAGLSSLSALNLADTPIADTDEFKTEVVMRLPFLESVSGESVTEEDRTAAADLKAQRKAEAEAAAAAAAAEAEADE